MKVAHRVGPDIVEQLHQQFEIAGPFALAHRFSVHYHVHNLAQHVGEPLGIDSERS